MKNLKIFVWILAFTICTSANATVDPAQWTSIGKGTDNETFRHKIKSDRVLTVIEATLPEKLDDELNSKTVDKFVDELKEHRALVNKFVGNKNWQITKYKFAVTPQGQKLSIEGTFEDRNGKRYFYENHFYENLSYRNYQLVEKKSDGLGKDGAFELLDKVAAGYSARVPANDDPNAGIAADCEQRRSSFIRAQAQDGDQAGSRLWDLAALRRGSLDNDQCAREFIQVAAEESHDYWTRFGRRINCLNENNEPVRGEGCSEEEFANIQRNLEFIETMENGLAPGEAETVAGTNCTTGNCDPATAAGSPIDDQQIAELGDLQNVLEQSIANEDRCQAYATHPDRMNAPNNASNFEEFKARAGRCVMSFLRSAWNDLSATFRVLWNAIRNRTLISSIGDALRSLRDDPVGALSTMISNIVAHFTEHYEGFECFNWRKRTEMFCQSGGQILALVVGGKGVNLVGRTARAGVQRTFRRPGPTTPSAPTVAQSFIETTRLTGAGVASATSIRGRLNARGSALQSVNYASRYRMRGGRAQYRIDHAQRRTNINALQSRVTEMRANRRNLTPELRTELRTQERLLRELKRDLRDMEKGLRRSQRVMLRKTITAGTISSSSQTLAHPQSEEERREEQLNETPPEMPADLNTTE